MKLELTKDEAIVLSEWLFRHSKTRDIFDDEAEQYVMWSLENQLEKLLVEPFYQNYSEILDKAREAVRGSY